MNLPIPARKPGPVSAKLAQCWTALAATVFAVLGSGMSGWALAAPLDAALSALPELEHPRGMIELATDQMNLELDVLRVREGDTKTAGTAAGDYHGYHLAWEGPVAEGLWVSGSLWSRAISSASDTFRYESFALSTQYRFLDGNAQRPALALRASIWGNRADATESTSPVTVPGAILNTVRVAAPSDRSVQLALIGTWVRPNQPILSASVGVGRTQLSYGGLTATTTRNGCDYNLLFNGNDIYGNLAKECTATGGVIQQFYDSSGAYGVDVAPEIAWRGQFWQVGGSAFWKGDIWSYKAGYLFHAVHREAVDRILASRDKPHYEQNHTVLLEAAYRLWPQWQLFGRAQLSSNLFFSEIPVTYNTSTSARFGSKYSLFTLGARWNF
jgi:hypothetical protein